MVNIMNWRKSSYSSGNGGECVEVGNADDVLVRDTSQAGTGPVLRFSQDAWRRFTDQAKRSLGLADLDRTCPDQEMAAVRRTLEPL